MPETVLRFQRYKRLSEANAYKRVFNANKRSVDNTFLILSHANNGFQYSRLGLAVSKKHLKNASDRNTIKRIIRESFREDAGHLQSYDFVVILKRRPPQINKKVLRESLNKLWKRIK